MKAAIQSRTKSTVEGAPFTAARTPLLQRQCACGGKAGSGGGECSECRRKKLLGDRTPSLQPKLTINQPGDRFEREADRIAEQVMRMPDSATNRGGCLRGQSQSLGSRGHLTRIPMVQRQVERTGSATPSARGIQTKLETGWQGGHALPQSVRDFFEPRFGHDFRQVRVHTDARASEAATAINARAFTMANHILFRSEEYAPETPMGRRLLAHELVHVIQQGRASGYLGGEGEAELRASEVLGNRMAASQYPGMVPHAIQRDGPEESETSAEPEEPPPVEVTWPEAYDLRNLSLGRGPILLPPFPFFPVGRAGPLPEVAPGPDVAPGPRIAPGSLIPSPEPERPEESGAEAPSRLSVFSHGSFSFGLRLGFPEFEPLPGAAPSLLAESLARAELMQQTLSGEVPSSWEALDKGLLAGWAWGVFSTYIAPDVARSLTESLSGSTGEGGMTFQLDATLFTDFSGGGLSFQLTF